MIPAPGSEATGNVTPSLVDEGLGGRRLVEAVDADDADPRQRAARLVLRAAPPRPTGGAPGGNSSTRPRRTAGPPGCRCLHRRRARTTWDGPDGADVGAREGRHGPALVGRVRRVSSSCRSWWSARSSTMIRRPMPRPMRMNRLRGRPDRRPSVRLRRRRNRRRVGGWGVGHRGGTLVNVVAR